MVAVCKYDLYTMNNVLNNVVVKSIVSDIHERRYKWTAAYFAERKIKKVEYIQLYKTKKRGKVNSLIIESY